MPETDPYLPPKAIDPSEEDNEAIRKAHLSTEANIELAGAALFVLVGLDGLLLAYSAFSLGVTRFLISLPATGIFGGLLFLLGRAIRAFSPVARVILTFFVGLILLRLLTVHDPVIVVCAALLGAFFFFVFWSPKANVVFSHRYREIVIPATSHVKSLS